MSTSTDMRELRLRSVLRAITYRIIESNHSRHSSLPGFPRFRSLLDHHRRQAAGQDNCLLPSRARLAASSTRIRAQAISGALDMITGCRMTATRKPLKLAQETRICSGAFFLTTRPPWARATSSTPRLLPASAGQCSSDRWRALSMRWFRHFASPREAPPFCGCTTGSCRLERGRANGMPDPVLRNRRQKSDRLGSAPKIWPFTDARARSRSAVS